jgi:hypothetical protein
LLFPRSKSGYIDNFLSRTPRYSAQSHTTGTIHVCVVWSPQRTWNNSQGRRSWIPKHVGKTNHAFFTGDSPALNSLQVCTIHFFIPFTCFPNSFICSGDNRDFCDYTHTLPNVPGTAMSTTPIREVTIKSFSMSVHIRRPGFHLLSLVDPATRTFPGQSSFADTACFLPDQSRIYTSFYGTLAFLTFLLLFVANLRRVHSQIRWRPEPISLSPSPRSTSGCNSPNSPMAHDAGLGSPTWSPNTPRSPSPRGSLPPTLRFPQGPTGPTLRASSRPGTPLAGSPLLSPSHMTFADRQEDDDEDAMHPAQYASRRDNHRHYEDEEWSDIGRTKEEDEFELLGGLDRGAASSRPLISRFILAPGHSTKNKPPSWSWSFVLAGRRRRITLRVPGWNSLADVRELFDFSVGSRHRRGLLWSTIIDGLNVFFLPLAVWFIIIWILS